MAAEENATVGAGTLIEFGDGNTDPGPEVFAKLAGLEKTFMLDRTFDSEDISDIDLPLGEFEYMEIPAEPQAVVILLRDKPGNTDQAAFVARADLRETINMRNTYPSGRISLYTIKTLGTRLTDAERKKVNMIEVPAKVLSYEADTFTA